MDFKSDIAGLSIASQAMTASEELFITAARTIGAVEANHIPPIWEIPPRPARESFGYYLAAIGRG